MGADQWADAAEAIMTTDTVPKATSREVMIDGLPRPQSAAELTGDVIEADPVAIAAGKNIELVLDIKLPEKAHLNAEAPWSTG